MQNMVKPVIFSDPLKNIYIARFFHHADNRMIAQGIIADIAGVAIGQTAANGTKMNFFFGVYQRIGKGFGIFFRLLQNTVSKPLRGFVADARQPCELTYKFIKRNY